MVQLHVATELQLDYTTDQPFQLPKASASAPPTSQERARLRQNRNKSHHAKEAVVDGPEKGLGDPGPIPPTYPGSTTAMNPQLAVVTDNDGLLTIFYDTFYGGPVDPKLPPDIDTEIRYMYQLPDFSWRQEVIPPPWPAGRNPQGRLGIKAARDPISGHIHLIYAYRIWPTKTLAHLELGGARFPKWTTTDCVNQNHLEGPGWPPASPIFDIGDFDLGFDALGNPVVAVTLSQPLPATFPWSSAGNFLWYPATNTVSYFGLDPNGTPPWIPSAVCNYDSLRYGTYPTPPARMSPNYGVIFHSVQKTDEPDSIKRTLLDNPGASIEVVTEAPHTGVFRSLSWFFLKGASTAPLGWVLDDNSAYFIYNNSGQGNPVDNLRPIFTDLPAGRHPLQISGMASLPDVSDVDNTNNILDVHAFAIFQCPDNTFELWHTRSVPGGAVQISDGVIDVPVGSWSDSALITKDIYCVADGLTSWLNVPYFTSLLIGNEPACFVVSRNRYVHKLQRESESTNWVLDEVQGQLVGVTPKAQTENIYYVEITALDDNGSPLSGILATIGADSPMVVTCAGVPHYIDATQTFDVPFNVAGKLGVSLPAKNSLVPSSFWIWAEGMDPSVKVDIQPGPNGLHDTFANLGVGSNPSLRTVKTQKGDLVVPATVPDEVVSTAQSALQQLSKVIKGDNANEPSDRLHVAQSTSPYVAKTRLAGVQGSHFHRLKPIPGLAFAIRFSPQPEFIVLTKEQAAARRAQIRAGVESNGFFDDIGDFFSDVAEAVVSVVEIVVEEVNNAYQATFHFIEDAICKALDAVLEFASEAASVATMVFNWVETTFETLYYWLAFIFDFKSFKDTADAFEAYFQAAGANLEVFIDNTVKVVTDKVYEQVRGEIDGFFDALVMQVGTQTVKDDSPPVPVAPTNDPRVLRFAGSKPNPTLDGISDIMSVMPSSASWLLEKIFGLLVGNEPEPLDAGVIVFENAMTNIETAIQDAFSSTEFQSAWDSMVSLVESMVSLDVFNGTLVAELLQVFKSFAKVILDLVHTVLDSFLDMFRFAAQSLHQVFNAAVDNPAIQLLYEMVTQGDTLTWSSLCALVIAIPHTILYKLITGQAPYSSPSDDKSQSSSHDELRMAIGIFNILRPIFLGVKSAAKLVERDENFAFTGRSPLGEFVKTLAVFYQGVVATTERINPITETNPLVMNPLEALTDENASNIAADILVVLQLLSSLTDTVGTKLLNKGGKGQYVRTFQETLSYVDAVFGIAGTICSAVAFRSQASPTTADIETLIGNIFTCVNTLMNLVDRRIKTPQQWAAVMLVRTTMCWSAGGLYIAASQQPSDDETVHKRAPNAKKQVRHTMDDHGERKEIDS